MQASIKAERKADRTNYNGNDEDAPSLNDISEFEPIVAHFIESVSEEAIDEECLDTIFEHRNIFKYYTNEKYIENIVSSDFVKALFLVDFFYESKWKIALIISSMIYKGSPFLDSLIENGLYDLVMDLITKYGDRSDRTFSLRAIAGLQCSCNLAEISEEYYQPLLDMNIVKKIIIMHLGYTVGEEEKFATAVHALLLSSKYSMKDLMPRFKLLWNFISRYYRDKMPSVVNDGLVLILRYFSSVEYVQHININEEKLEVLFELLAESNTTSDTLDLFVEMCSIEDASMRLLELGFVENLLQFADENNEYYYRCYVVLSCMMDYVEQIECVMTKGNLQERIIASITEGSIKEGMGAALCIAKIMKNTCLEYIYSIINSEIAETMLSYCEEEDPFFLKNFLEGLLVVLQKESGIEKESRIFLAATEEEASRIEELTLIENNEKNEEIIEYSNSILEILSS